MIKSMLGCVPVVGWGVATHRIYKEYHKAKDLKTHSEARSIFSLMNKGEVAHAACEYIPIAGPMLYGGGKLIYLVAQKVCSAWKRVKQKRVDSSTSNASPVLAPPPSVTLQITNLSDLATLNRETLIKFLAKPIVFRTTEASIDMPCPSAKPEEDQARLKRLAERFPKADNQSKEDYEKELAMRLSRQNLSEPRTTASSASHLVTDVYSGILLAVGNRNRSSTETNPSLLRYEITILPHEYTYLSFKERAENFLPYGYHEKGTVSFFVSDAELQKFNTPTQQ